MSPNRSTIAVVTAALLLSSGLSGCAGEHTTGDQGQSGPHHADTSTHTGTHTGTDAGAHEGMDMGAMAPISPPPDSADWNVADATYLTMMVSHHSQALDMAELAETRAVDPRVRAIAETIRSGQGREIIVMATWLVDHGQPEPTPDSVAAMSSTGMPGMLTQTQLAELGETDGAAFDRQFLEDMIQHHQGAVAMAEDEIGTGRDVRAVEMATEVVAGQNAEIVRMRRILADLP